MGKHVAPQILKTRLREERERRVFATWGSEKFSRFYRYESSSRNATFPTNKTRGRRACPGFHVFHLPERVA
jgi:hypothetical protein